MSKFTIYSYPNNYRVHKVQICAAYVGIEIKEPGFRFGEDNEKPAFLALNPLGKVPVLETPSGPIWESNAIARYVAGFRADKGLLGDSFYDNALVAQWVDFSANELENPRAAWVYPLQGIMKFNQNVHDEAVKDVTNALTILDHHLVKNTYVVGNHVTLADIALVTALAELYTAVFTVAFIDKFPNAKRWFQLCTNQPEFIQVLGKITLNAKTSFPVPPGKEGKEPKEAAGGEAKAEKPAAAEKPKADKPKQAKAEPEKQKPAAAPAAAAPAAAATANSPEYEAQAAKVRSLKAAKAPRPEVEAAVAVLKEIKAREAAEAAVTVHQ